MTIKEKIQLLRSKMKENNLQTYIVSKFDPHQSEYSNEFFNSIKFISGFSGSTAMFVITEEEAGLWVDGRYFIQADNELKDTGIIVQKIGQKDVKEYLDYVVENTKNGDNIGLDGSTISCSSIKTIEDRCKEKNIKINPNVDLIGEMWADRPELSNELLFNHDLKYAGLSFEQKLEQVKEMMDKDNVNVHVISTLEDIAWLTNLRGHDTPTLMTFRSYVVIKNGEVNFFVDKNKLVNVKLSDKIKVFEYDEVFEYIEKNINKDDKVALKLLSTNYKIYSTIKSITENIKDIKNNYTEILKAKKSDVEINGMKNAYIRDCVALVKTIKYVKENANNLNEYEIDALLTKYRSEQDNYLKPSFDTIAGYNANAAMMHYSATKENCTKLKNEGFLLIDSGAQYLDGTTDITRTIVLGEITDEMKKDFTLVLKSMMAVANAIFLKGAHGAQIDMLARKPMWDNHMDYKSGTGHGIGFCLNVHEGPQGISGRSTTPLELGMAVTNEPGVYKQDKYGIRTENTEVVVESGVSSDGEFYKFLELTYAPIDVNAIDVKLLDDVELRNINEYHKEVYNKLSPFLNDEEKAWLKTETRELSR